MYWGAAFAFVFVAFVELVVRNERRAWLLPLARLRLTPTRRFALPPLARPEGGASYRDRALRGDDALPRVGAFRAGGLRFVPGADGAGYAVVSAGWRVEYLLRVDARREGDDVVLGCRYAPSPASLPVGSAALLATLLLRHGPASAFHLMPAALVCFALVPFSAFRRARGGAEKAAARALEALEGQMVRAHTGQGAAPEPERAPWGGRAGAVVALALLAFCGAKVAEGRRTVPRELVARYGLDEREAERLAPFVSEFVRGLQSNPEAKAAYGGRALSTRARAEVFRRGYARLSDAEVLELQALRERLAETSAPLCASFLGRGGGDDRLLLSTLARQDDAFLRSWFWLNGRAAELALAGPGAEAPADPDATFGDGIKAMARSLPENERAAFVARFLNLQTEAALCDAFRAASEGLRRLDAPARAPFLRAFAAMSNAGGGDEE